MKIKSLVVSIIVFITMIGCETENMNYQGLVLELDKSEINLDYLAGSSDVVNIQTSVSYLKIYTSTDGVSVNTESIIEINNNEIKKNNYQSINNLKYEMNAVEGGYQLKISALQNNEKEMSVQEYYVVKSADGTSPLSVVQNTKGDVVEKETEFYPEGGAYELEVAPASGKEIVVDKLVGDDWLTYTYDKSAQKIIVTAANWKNEDGITDRNGALRIQNTSQGNMILGVKQQAPFVQLDKTIILVSDKNINETVNVTTNMAQGTIALSEKLEAQDPNNLISASALEYADNQTRNASFTITVNADGLSFDTSARYNIIGIGEATGLTMLEKGIVISRSQVLFEETFSTGESDFANVWERTKGDKAEYTSLTFNQTPLSYSDSNGEYILSGIGRTLQRNYYANKNSISVQHVSPTFTPITEGEIYASFLFKLDQLPYRDNNSGNYHAVQYSVLGFSDSGTSRIASLWVGKVEREEKYRFGLTLASNNGGKVLWYDKEFFDNTDQTFFLVLKYNVGTKRFDLFINPTLTHTQPEPALYIDLETNNPQNDTNTASRVRTLFTLENTNNANVNCQIGGIRVGRTWDEAVQIKNN